LVSGSNWRMLCVSNVKTMLVTDAPVVVAAHRRCIHLPFPRSEENATLLALSPQRTLAPSAIVLVDS